MPIGLQSLDTTLCRQVKVEGRMKYTFQSASTRIEEDVGHDAPFITLLLSDFCSLLLNCLNKSYMS